MAKDLAIILNSGSLNSAVATALAVQKYRPILLHGEMTSPVGTRMRVAYDQQVAHFKPYREHTLSMPFLSAIESTVPTPAGIADPRQQTPIAPTVLRLLPLIAAAVRFAVHYQAAAIYIGLRIGVQSEELAQASEYVQVWNEMINLPLGKPDLELHAPLLELEPWQVVDVGVNVATPFDRTWTCLEDLPEPCGACRGCRVRDAAFQQAAKPDPMKAVRK
jgi:7-cyano-7-deazaguanine synthase in queuosine biosynthesis